MRLPQAPGRPCVPPLLGDVVPGCPQSETGRGVILSKRSATKDLAPGAGSDSGASMDIRTSPRLCRRGGGLSPPGGIGDKQEKGSANSQHLRIRRSFLPSYDPGVRGPPRASRRARNIPTREKHPDARETRDVPSSAVTFQALLRRSKLCSTPTAETGEQALRHPAGVTRWMPPPLAQGRFSGCQRTPAPTAGGQTRRTVPPPAGEDVSAADR